MPRAKRHTEDRIGQIRRARLKSLIAERGGPNAIAHELGYKNASFLSQMCCPNPIREVTEKTARSFERKLGLAAPRAACARRRA